MRKIILGLILFFLFWGSAVGAETVELPEAEMEGEISLEKSIERRRSERDFLPDKISLEKAAQLLWAAQGITDPGEEFRSAPSAGALYPLEVYLLAGEVEDLEAGLYKYVPEDHELEKKTEGDLRGDLANAAMRQGFILDAPASIVITAFFERSAFRYGDRARRFVHMEAGHAGQNIFLQSVALGLGTVGVGSFTDEQVHDLLKLEEEETPLYIFPVGYIDQPHIE